jgi:hypothetical protein
MLRTTDLPHKREVSGLPKKGEVLYADVTNIMHKCYVPIIRRCLGYWLVAGVLGYWLFAGVIGY